MWVRWLDQKDEKHKKRDVASPDRSGSNEDPRVSMNTCRGREKYANLQVGRDAVGTIIF
jgi:hypothetical protein